MKYHDSHADSKVKMQSAVSLLDEHDLAYTPVNYAVAYEYVSGVNQELVHALDQYIADHNVDPFVMESLSSEFINMAPVQDNTTIVSLSGNIDSMAEVCNQSTSGFISLDEQIKGNLQSSAQISEIAATVSALQVSQEKLQSLVLETQEQAKQICDELTTAKLAALTDPLTNLKNRQGLKNTFEMYVQEQQKSDLCVAMVDIDHFKNFNDAYGHLIGDVILRRIAKLLNEQLKGMGEAFRYGGEEFLVMIPNTHSDKALAITEEIREKVAKLRFVSAKTKERLPKLTISIGLSKMQNNDEFDAIVSRADDAMYKAKNAGRNRVVVG